MYALQIALVLAVFAALAAAALANLRPDRCARHTIATRIAAANCTHCKDAAAGQPSAPQLPDAPAN